MKRNIRVIEINGIRGILTIIYAVICAAAGFIIFPAWGIMHLWNYVATNIYPLPKMNLLLGFLSYTFLILLYFATKSQKSFLGITSASISKTNIAAVMKDIEDEENRR